MRVIAAISLAVAALGAQHAAVAGSFEITPTSIELAAPRAPGSVTVVNTGTSSVRFQVKAFEWSQNERGLMVLVASHDLVVYPQLFTIPPGGRQSLRVASLVAGRDRELSYRIMVQELPSDEPARGTITLLTQMGVPVFVAPTTRRESSDVHVAVSGGKAAVAVVNRGTLHVRVDKVHVVGLSGGRTVFERAATGWYILPGDRQLYDVELPADACEHIDTLRVVAALGRKRITTQIEASAPEACGHAR